MLIFWKTLFGTGSFIPHGHCYLWQPELVWLNVFSDAAIALAYFSIPITLVVFIQKREDLPFSWIFALFGLFIVACGTGHILDIWTLWHPTYWLSSMVKLFAALVSVTTAIALIPLIPLALALPSPKQLQDANEKLEAEVTERKRTEVALKDALADAQGLNAILDNLVDGLLVTNTAGHVTRVNPALADMYAVEMDRLVEQNSTWLTQTNLMELVQQNQQQPDRITTTEVELANGRVGQAVAKTIFKQAGEQTIHMGSAVLIRDVTREWEIDRMKTDFISTVSHELRTPLTSVLGFTSMIKERLDEDIIPAMQAADHKLQRAIRKVDANLTIIISEAERLTALINDVLDIAKMEAGKVDWHLEAVDPTQILEQAIAATASLFVGSGLELQQEISPNLPMIDVDRDRIIQVVINLLSNAAKFTEQGVVTCGADLQGDYVCIRVSDTGIGIAPQDQPKIFEKFRQVGNILTDKPKGTGLGLSICQQIIKHHGGNIWVESTPNVGSTFFFTLPLHRQHDSLRRSLQSDVELVAKRLRNHIMPVSPSVYSGQKTILVVDDDANIRELLRQQLETEGYLVDTAIDGMSAIQQLKVTKPDLIIMDVMMPQISGFDVAAIVKHDPQTADIPIIILSIVEDQERGCRLGVDRYLIKPIDSTILLRDIAALLSQENSSRKVLVVDRNASTLKTLSEVLQSQGYSVTAASSDQECLDKAIAEKPDMIIIESWLSQESDLVKTLRFEKGMENVLFVVLGDR